MTYATYRTLRTLIEYALVVGVCLLASYFALTGDWLK